MSGPAFGSVRFLEATGAEDSRFDGMTLYSRSVTSVPTAIDHITRA